MNKVYAYAVKLQDLFSPQMQKLAVQYEQKTSWMTRQWSKFTGMLNASGQAVSSLRGKLTGLASGFKIKVDSSDVDKASGKTFGLLSKLKSFVGQSTIAAGLVGGLASGGAMGIIDTIMGQISNISDKTVGAAQSSQSTRFTLNELMGKGNAGSLVKNVDAYAPEKRDQLLSSAQKLSGSGVESSSLMDTLKYLNNISALTGSKVDELAMIQAKIKATGYVQGDEINMFKERGINLNPYLAKTMGIKDTDVAKAQSKGLITYDIFDKAMQKYAGKGSKYENVYERKMLSTTEGREELVSGKLDAKLRGIGEKLLPIKDSILVMFNDVLNGTGPVIAVFDKLWNAIKPVFEGVQGLLQRLGIFNEQGRISEGVFNTLTFVWEYLGNLFEVAGGLIWGVSKALGWLIDSPLAMLIVGIYGAVKAWGALNLIMSLNPFSLIIIGLAAVVAGVMYAWDKFDGFREGILRVWETIKSVFSNLGDILKAMLTGTVGDVIAAIGKAWSEGAANGISSVNEDRLNRLNERRAGRRNREGQGGMPSPDSPFSPTGPASGSLASAAGLSSTVGNSKSSNITINVKSLIEKSDITVMDFQGSLDDLESKLIDVLLRVVNSGTRAITA